MCDRKPHLNSFASGLCQTIRSLWVDRQRIRTDIHIWMLFAEGCIRPHFVHMEPGAEPVCRFMCRGLQDAVGPGIGGGTECLGGMTVGTFGIGKSLAHMCKPVVPPWVSTRMCPHNSACKVIPGAIHVPFFVVFVQPGKTLEPPDRGDRTLTSLPNAYHRRAWTATSCQDWPGPSIACDLRDRAVPLSVLGPWHRMGMFVEDAGLQVLDYWGGMPR